MFFEQGSTEIQLGDWVIVYSSRDQLASIFVTAGGEFQSRFGHFKHDAMVGVKWGTKFQSANGRGFVYLLKPTPELWTQALPHRTQILYLPDIAFITSYLDIKANSKVIEAGTGSGSLSHSLARTVGPCGRVHSFEFHEERFEKAKVEFEKHGLDGIVKVKHQDVYKMGFELIDEVDSVFLDLPAPWLAVPHAKIALRKDRQARICCFSPCIEQVIRTVAALSEAGFADITMYETLQRSYDLVQTTTLPDISTAVTRIKGVEEKKTRRREGQIREAKRKREAKENPEKGDSSASVTEGKLEKEPESEGDAEGRKGGAKRRRIENAVGEDDNEGDAAEGYEAGRQQTNGHLPPPTKISMLKPAALSRGHTSFLTFATLLPIHPTPSTTEAPKATDVSIVSDPGPPPTTGTTAEESSSIQPDPPGANGDPSSDAAMPLQSES